MFLIQHQGLLAVPFVLHSHPTAVFEPNGESVEQQANVAQRRYAEILRDVEEIINDHSESLNRIRFTSAHSKLAWC